MQLYDFWIYSSFLRDDTLLTLQKHNGHITISVILHHYGSSVYYITQQDNIHASVLYSAGNKKKKLKPSPEGCKIKNSRTHKVHRKCQIGPANIWVRGTSSKSTEPVRLKKDALTTLQRLMYGFDIVSQQPRRFGIHHFHSKTACFSSWYLNRSRIRGHGLAAHRSVWVRQTSMCLCIRIYVAVLRRFSENGDAYACLSGLLAYSLGVWGKKYTKLHPSIFHLS